jgi:hypothetical protein
LNVARSGFAATPLVSPAPRQYRSRWSDCAPRELGDHAPFRSRRGVTQGRVSLPSRIRWQAEPLVVDVPTCDWQRLREQ